MRTYSPNCTGSISQPIADSLPLQFYFSSELIMAIKWPWAKKQEAPAGETRSVDVPDKVYIEKQPTGYEYSPDRPRIIEILNQLFEGYYGDLNLMTLFYCLPEVFAPINEIATRVADTAWQLRKEWNDEVDYKNEDFNRLFSQPNPLNSIQDLVYMAVCYELVTGKQFFYINKPDTLALSGMASIAAWWNLPAHRTRAVLKDNVNPLAATSIADFILRYDTTVGGRQQRLDPPKVLQMCRMSLQHPYDPNCAKSPLMGADKAIRNLVPVYEARGTIYIKRGALGFLVSRKEDESGLVAFTAKEREQLNKDANDTYGLTGNKSTIGITNQPVEFVRTAMSISELEPFEETLADAVAIYATLRVPRHLVPSKDQSTYANAASDMKTFYADVIIPMANRYAQAWTTFFGLKEDRRYIYPDFSKVPVLQENQKEKSEVDFKNGQTYLTRWMNGACTLNEWIVANDGNKVSSPLYDKKLLEMTPEELDQVRAVINLKSAAVKPQPEDTNNENVNDNGSTEPKDS